MSSPKIRIVRTGRKLFSMSEFYHVRFGIVNILPIFLTKNRAGVIFKKGNRREVCAVNLSEALQIRPGVTAIIGGGGKTTLMERLAHELSGKARVIVCTTTHIYPEKTMPCLVSPAQAEIAAALEKSPCICVGAWSENGKFGPPELPVGTLARLADYVIVEADGAKRLPLKAHAAHEPVIPPEANQTILVVGASGFGRPMCETVHRAPLAAQALGVPEDTVVTPALWARFLEHEHLHTRVLVNQADLPQGRELARRLAAGLCCPVCAAALQKEWIECLS